MHSRITHIEYYLPEKEYSNESFFADFPDLVNNKNLYKIGVKSRRIAAEDQAASDLAFYAGEKLLEKWNIDRSSIDFLIYSSLDFDYKMPSTSNVLHQRLGLSPHCGTIDFNHGCSAYVYGLGLAQGFIASGTAKKILLLSANTLTKDIHPRDKASRFVFGDGGAATLIEADSTTGIGQCVYMTDSKGFEKIIVRDGGARNRITEESFAEIADEYGNVTTKANFFMDGTGVFMFSLKRVPEIIKETLEKNKLNLSDIDLFIFHQANLYMIDTIVGKAGIASDKVFNNMEFIGNTVGATIPIALKDAMEKGRIKPGSKVLVIGFGVGLSLSATVLYF